MGCGQSKDSTSRTADGPEDVAKSKQKRSTQENIARDVATAKRKRIAVAAQNLASGADIEVTMCPKSQNVIQLISKSIVNNLLFQNLKPEVKTVLIGTMSKLEVHAGEDIIKQGDTAADKFYVISTGTCKVLQKGENEEERLLSVLSSGTSFGELALLYNCPRNATVRADTECELWVMEQKVYMAIKKAHEEKVQQLKLDLIKSVPSFQNFNDEQRNALANALEPVTFEKNEYVFKKGDIGENFYIIQEGAVEVQDENKKVLSELKAGASFGERALVHDDVRAASIMAVGTGAVCLFLNRTDFQAMLGTLEEAWRYDALSKVGLLGNCNQAQLTEMSKQLIKIKVAPGEFVFKQGAEGDSMFLVSDGSLNVLDASKEAGQNVIRVLKRGDHFGELAILNNSARAASVQNGTGDTELLKLERSTFESVFGSLKSIQLEWRMETLRKVPLFSKLTVEQRKQLAEVLQPIVFEAGKDICVEGEEGNSFYVIEQGVVDVLSGQDVLTQLKGGSYFGELAILRNEVRSKTIRAQVKCSLLSCNRDDFQKVLGPLQALLDSQAEAYDSVGAKIQLKRIDEMKQIAVLGVGAFGKVVLCKYNGKPYAVKCLSKAQVMATGLQQHVMQERNVMMACHSPFFVNLMGTHQDKDYLYMILETVMGGELFAYLQMRDDPKIPESQARFYTACVIEAFQYLNDRNYIYRDLKPENLLIDTNGYIKVADFGFAKELTSGKTYTTCGTPDYMCPELIKQSGHTKAVDWWALGVLIYELVCGYPPFSNASDEMEQMQMILKGKFDFPHHVSSDCRDLVKSLMAMNPTKRLGCLVNGSKDVKKHAWFKGFDWEALGNRTLKAPYIPRVKDPFDTGCFEEMELDVEHPGQGYKQRRVEVGTAFDDF